MNGRRSLACTLTNIERTEWREWTGSARAPILLDMNLPEMEAIQVHQGGHGEARAPIRVVMNPPELARPESTADLALRVSLEVAKMPSSVAMRRALPLPHLWSHRR